jgi:iron complex outermembrane receptor protein
VTARALALALPLAATVALAQEPEPAPERVEIIGSRLPRLNAETAAPVKVIRREEIERSGAVNAEELLDRVTANFGGFREAMGLGDADTPGMSGASLRGFGAGETLVLLNGRRLANYAFTGTGGPGVDLHAIPLAAIERVEVLKDGASALYGSDAVAGVINFVTRSDYAGADATLGARASEAGGGGRRRATLALGRGDASLDGYNVFGVIDVQHQQRLRAVDRPFAATSYRPELGLDNTQPTAWPANILTQDNPRNGLLNPIAPGCTALTVNKEDACWFDFARLLELLQPSRQANLFGRGTWRLNEDSEAYAELSMAWSRIRFAVAPTPVSRRTTVGGRRVILPESSPYYPTGLGLAGDLELSYRTVPLGPRTSDSTSTNTRLLVGAKSRWAGWDVDGAVAINDSRSKLDYVSGFVPGAAVVDAIASGLVNPFGPSSAEGDALLAASQLQGLARRARGRTHSVDLHGSRELAVWSAGPLALAAGVEARHERLSDEELPIVGDVAGGGIVAPKRAQRNAQAVYAELVAPLTRALELQAAARWDRYSDFGSALSPKLAVRLQPATTWLVRASVGRGFRAPSLPELFTLQTRDVGTLDTPDPVRCPVTGLLSDCIPEVEFVNGGNPALQPQRSTQANVGLVVQPAASWQASLDVWSIRLRDIIDALDAGHVIDNLSRYEGRNVIRGPVDPAFPGLPGPLAGIETINENLGDWRVEGADVSLALQPQATPVGRVSLQFDGTYVRRARQSIFEGNVVDLIGRRAPRWQHVLTVALDRGARSATLSQRFRRGYRDTDPLPDGSIHHVAPYRVWDAQLAVAATRNVRLTLGVRNLLDTAPPVTNQTAQFQLGYDPLYADPLGRTWTLDLAWRLD